MFTPSLQAWNSMNKINGQKASWLYGDLSLRFPYFQTTVPYCHLPISGYNGSIVGFANGKVSYLRQIINLNLIWNEESVVLQMFPNYKSQLLSIVSLLGLEVQQYMESHIFLSLFFRDE